MRPAAPTAVFLALAAFGRLPSQAVAGEGCDAVCKTEHGAASCGYRMQWAALHRYRSQAQACDLAMVLANLDCPGICGSCEVEESGCEAALKRGKVDKAGQPASDASPTDAPAAGVQSAAAPAVPAANAADAADGGDDDAAEAAREEAKRLAAQREAARAAEAEAERRADAARKDALERMAEAETAREAQLHRGAPVATEPERPHLAAGKKVSNAPYIVAGIAVIAVVSGWIAAMAAKVLGWELPATRAAQQAAQRGMMPLQMTSPGVPLSTMAGPGGVGSPRGGTYEDPRFKYKNVQMRDGREDTYSGSDLSPAGKSQSWGWFA